MRAAQRYVLDDCVADEKLTRSRFASALVVTFWEEVSGREVVMDSDEAQWIQRKVQSDLGRT